MSLQGEPNSLIDSQVPRSRSVLLHLWIDLNEAEKLVHMAEYTKDVSDSPTAVMLTSSHISVPGTSPVDSIWVSSGLT